jgi:hypothetical protein
LCLEAHLACPTEWLIRGAEFDSEMPCLQSGRLRDFAKAFQSVGSGIPFPDL